MTPILCSTFTACSKNTHVIDEILVVDSKSIVTHEHSFSINFKMLLPCQSDIYVQIVEPSTGAFWIKENIIKLNDDQGTVNFLIDDKIAVNSVLSYNLKFWFKTDDGVFHEQTVYDFNTYYIDEHDTKLDFPVVTDISQTITNTHIFKFTIQFDKEPTDTEISLSLLNDASGKLSLEQDVVPVQHTGSFPTIDVYIDLDISVFQTEVFCFSLDITFINSYGCEQKNHFYGLTAKFSKQLTDQIPDDYYDIEEKSNKVILKGLKSGVNKLEAGNYREMVIPNNVTDIQTEAFTDKNWCKNIHLLDIPSSVKTINRGAFNGLINLTEIDLSEYSDKPSWSSTKNLFDAKNFQTVGGYVWANNLDDLASFETDVHNWGLPELWQPFNDDMVSKSGDFSLTNKGTVLNGINMSPDTLERWKHIKVIKIPDTVERISINALDRLKKIPYEKPHAQNFENKYETRRLILNDKLENIPEHLFMSLGISGPILTYCDKLTTFPWGCFSDAASYGSPALLDVEVEPMYFILSDSFNIEDIDDYCFNMTPLANKDLIFPPSVKNIGSFAFQGHRFETITFTHNIETVKPWAFANTYAYPSEPTIKEIDLSGYKVVLNPGAEQADWTYIPMWMADETYMFDHSCIDDGQTHYVYFSNKLFIEANSKEGGFDKWFSTFLTKHAIPSSWQYQIK